jgi:type IV pilus assembly protein PilM
MLEAIFDEMNERFEIPVERIEQEGIETGKTGSVPANLLLSLGLALKEVK